MEYLDHYIKGIKGILKSTLGVDKADNELVMARVDLCINCDKRDGKKCSECGCFISMKTKIKGEKCPLDKW